MLAGLASPLRPGQSDLAWSLSVPVRLKEVVGMGKYDGVHSFLFIPWADEPQSRIEAILSRWEPGPNGPLHFASVLQDGGDFGGFAHFSARNTDALGRLIATDLYEAGIRSDYETEGVVYQSGGTQPMGPKRRSPRFSALCRVRVKGRPPLDVLEAIADNWNAKAPFIGASQLLRRSRLLVELGDDDDRALSEDHIPALRGIPGVDKDEFEVGVADAGATAA
jgi:hypothetical protein